jgi:GAF domain-containing protein
LADALSAVARDLEPYDDPAVVLTEIVAAAVALVPGAEEGSISVVMGRRQVTSEAATSDLPRHVDALQMETGQGPCLDAAFGQHTVRVDDLSAELRWPRFAQRASETGAAGMLSLQLFIEGDNIGALNLYSRTPGAFSDESEQVGLLFAAHAAIAYAATRKEAQLSEALANRDEIGQAKGILMERYKITADRAFLVLVRVSQQTNRKLHQVAAELAQTGTLPEVPRAQQ